MYTPPSDGSLAEPVSVLPCRNSKKKRTRGRKRGWSLSGNGRKGKRNESGRESGGTARGRRNESGNGRGKEKERGSEKETKTGIAGPESETTTGTGTGAKTRVQIAVDPGQDKNINTQIREDCFQQMCNVYQLNQICIFVH